MDWFDTKVDNARVPRLSTSAKSIGKSNENPLWATNTFGQYITNIEY